MRCWTSWSVYDKTDVGCWSCSSGTNYHRTWRTRVPSNSSSTDSSLDGFSVDVHVSVSRSVASFERNFDSQGSVGPRSRSCKGSRIRADVGSGRSYSSRWHVPTSSCQRSVYRAKAVVAHGYRCCGASRTTATWRSSSCSTGRLSHCGATECGR